MHTEYIDYRWLKAGVSFWENTPARIRFVYGIGQDHYSISSSGDAFILSLSSDTVNTALMFTILF